MGTRTATLAAVTAAALALAPIASASAAKPDPKPKNVKTVKTGLSVTKLSIVGKKTRDVAKKDAKLKLRVQVKDKSKAFDPESVRLRLVEKVTGEENDAFTITAKRAGKSKKVTNWVGKVVVPKGSVAPGETATYCVKLVKVNADDPTAAPVTETAKGLRGRDCVKVVNSATA